MEKNNQYLFEESPVFHAVIRLAVPTVMGQIILVVYNMADTFFVGLTGSDAKLAAVTVCMPAFMFLSAISNLFGVGGAAVMSRAMGRKNHQRAAGASALAIWGCLLTTVLYSLGAFLLRHTFVRLLGGITAEVHDFAVEYLLVTVVAGGIFTAMNTLFSHLVRAEGRSFAASMGIALGGILNIFLDPLFMFVLLPAGKETLGAAMATALSNVIACGYFLFLLKKIRREGSVINARITEDSLIDGSAREILLNGLPACLMTLFENVSYAVLDRLMATHGMAYQAGIGVAKKVNMLAHCVVRGMSQGVLPLLAYTYASGNHDRMRKAFSLSAAISVAVSLAAMVVCLSWSPRLVGIFIPEGSQSLAYGARFLRILCVGCPFSAFAYAVISFFQAIGKSGRSFWLAIMRKGAVDIPLMFILGKLMPVDGIVLATPAADIVCCLSAAVLFALCMHGLNATVKEDKLKALHYRPRLIGTGETHHA